MSDQASCCGKVSYATERDARQALVAIRTRKRTGTHSRFARAEQNVYKCELGAYHLTSSFVGHERSWRMPHKHQR